MWVFDAPQGVVPGVEWDQPFQAEDLTRICNQVQAIQTNDSTIVVIFHKTSDSQMVADTLGAANYCHLQNLCWYKGETHQTKTPVSSYTNSWEIATIGFQPNRNKVAWNMEKDPSKRHNFIECKAVTRYHRDSDGKVINPCQKPPDIMRWLCQNHLSPGSTLLVVGAGAGGEIAGAVQACCNVVAVERDTRQYDALQSVLVKHIAVRENALLKAAERNNNSDNDDVERDQQSEVVGGDDTEKKLDVTCIECSQKITSEGLNVSRVCKNCALDAPLHINCAEQVKDGFLCHTCYRKEAEDEQQGSLTY